MIENDTVTVGPPQVEREKHPFTGFIDFQGLPVDVENLRGSLREGVDRDGHQWSTVMLHHYGEVRGSLGADGDPVDVYVGPDGASDLVVVVHQNHPDTGRFDEEKVMLGFRDVADALDAYRAQYDRPGFYGGHDVVPFETFAEWCELTRPAFEKGASGGPYIGERGGLWADPQHKVHWTPTAHGVQADWVGQESEERKKERAARVDRAVETWKAAAEAYKEHRDQRTYQRAYDALHELGHALNLQVGKGDDYASAALKWLRAQGHKATLAAPRRVVARPEQGGLFKSLTIAEALQGYGHGFIARLYRILASE